MISRLYLNIELVMSKLYCTFKRTDRWIKLYTIYKKYKKLLSRNNSNGSFNTLKLVNLKCA